MDTIRLGILVILLMILGQSSAYFEQERRLCGDDFTTAGQCFLAIPLSLEWAAADLYCRHNLPAGPGGRLAELNEQLSQDLVVGLASSIGSPDVWINYKRNAPRRWRWLGVSVENGFQGCWVEDTFNPVFPTLSTNSTTKPSDCLAECKSQYNYLSVQTDERGNLVCRCGDDFGLHNQSYSSQCDTPCPVSSTEVINRNCAAPGHRLIYQTDGQTYHNFAPANSRQYEHCVVFDHRFGHKWAEHSCMDKLPFVCEYFVQEQSCFPQSPYPGRDDVCFTIHAEPKNFYEAQEVCNKIGGYLVEVTNAEANNAIVSLLDDSKSYFMALTDDEFLSSDRNILLNIFNWGPNQPTYEALQSCVSMKASDPGFWYNIDCNTRLPFICMVDIKPSTEPYSVPVNTTTAAKTTTTATDSPSKDLIIGISVGAGGALILVILTILCICFIRRSIQQKALSHHKPAGTKSQGRHPRMSNPAYQPDVILNHQVPRSGQRGEYDNPSPVHTHRSSVSYLDLYDSIKSLHTYESIKSGNSSYQNHSRRY